ncbi:MAG: pyridoxal-dependent decarboxylase [Alphaproteobacteria bacterium]
MNDKAKRTQEGATLDPKDWSEIRASGHRMLDDMFDYLEHIRERPVWQPIPNEARTRFRDRLPRKASPLDDAYADFQEFVLPYTVGNCHPGFMGWVHGGGTAVGMLGEMLAGGLNANLGGRDHMPIEVERQVTEWVREMFGFPGGSSGLFVTGTSIANFIALLVARTKALGTRVRKAGLGPDGAKLRAYTSSAAHSCVSQAVDLAGLGFDALRRVPTDHLHRMSIEALRTAIAADRAAGLSPFAVIGTAGTVETGAIDDLSALADLCAAEGLWFHIDGAFGALGVLSPQLAPKLYGIDRADSIALDFHKWGQVPYDAGFVLVRDGALHRATFASEAAYLRRETRGLAAGSPWPCDFGPDLSRGFRALKTWLTIKVYGADQLGSIMARTCALAQHLEERVKSHRELELMAPAQLNIVCFRYRCEESDRINAEIVTSLQESGVCAPSTTLLNGQLAIRAAFVNHRTQIADVDALVDAVISTARALTAQKHASGA